MYCTQFTISLRILDELLAGCETDNGFVFHRDENGDRVLTAWDLRKYLEKAEETMDPEQWPDLPLWNSDRILLTENNVLRFAPKKPGIAHRVRDDPPGILHHETLPPGTMVTFRGLVRDPTAFDYIRQCFFGKMIGLGPGDTRFEVISAIDFPHEGPPKDPEEYETLKGGVDDGKKRKRKP